MNSPKRPDGPPVREGKPYSAIAHLAESVTPFVAMAHGLRGHGFSAPAIFAADRKAGLLVIEDLGEERRSEQCKHIPETRSGCADEITPATPPETERYGGNVKRRLYQVQPSDLGDKDGRCGQGKDGKAATNRDQPFRPCKTPRSHRAKCNAQTGT
jgi:hypothetical protein